MSVLVGLREEVGYSSYTLPQTYTLHPQTWGLYNTPYLWTYTLPPPQRPMAYPYPFPLDLYPTAPSPSTELQTPVKPYLPQLLLRAVIIFLHHVL